MKRIVVMIAALTLCGAGDLLAEDSATQERIQWLTGQVQDLAEAQRNYQKQISDLRREIAELRELLGKPNASYLTHDDLKPLRSAIEEVDRKRMDDAKQVKSKLEDLAKTLTSSARRPETASSRGTTERTPTEGYEYTIERGDTLSTIVAAYRSKGVKVTTDQVVKANKGLNPDLLIPGTKIIIPDPGK